MPRIVAKMATFPARYDQCLIAVNSLLDQVDLVTVYCNQYDSAPSYLNHRKIKPILGLDIGDGGKLHGEQGSDYTFLVDDDLRYPANYVAKMKRAIDSYGGSRIIGAHAAILRKDPKNYFSDRSVWHFAAKINSTFPVNVLGTGTVAFSGDLVRLSEISPVMPNMLDVYFAVYCQSRGIGMSSIARPTNWIQQIPIKQSIWGSRGDGRNQTRVINQIHVWKVY